MKSSKPKTSVAIIDPTPIPPDVLAARWIARRYGRPIAVARLIAEQAQLAGIASRGR